jgi:catalase
MQGKDFNHMTKDLIAAIDKGDYPKWDLYIQVLTPEQLAKFDFDPLDATKIWPNVPETKIGTMTLNKNPTNVFLETEQAALAPSNLVPGIEPSEDRLLQGRIFSYADTQLYRVGANGLQLPINRPRTAAINYNQDGELNAGAKQGDVNYQPSQRADVADAAVNKYSRLSLSGTTQQQRIARTQNFKQAGDFYRSLSAQEQANLVSNLAGDLGQVKDDGVKYTMLSYFQKADANYGRAITLAVKADPARVEALAGKLQD